MILLASSLTNAPVMGIQTSSELGRLRDPVIDPGTLKVLAYNIEGPLVKQQPTLLRIADVRELSDIGFIVDSSDEFVSPSDIIKLDKIYQLGFRLMGMPVTDEKRRRLGKVADYTIETGSFVVQQLTVRRPLFTRLNDTELLIHRSQIIEINDSAIVVHSQAKAPEPELHEVVGSYVNPFRKSSPAAESIDSTKR